MARSRVRLLMCLILSASVLQAQTLSSEKRNALRKALGEIGVQEYELGFDKLWVEDDTFRLALIDTLMLNPLRVPVYGDDFAKSLPDSMGGFGRFVKARARDLDCALPAEPTDSIDAALQSVATVEEEPFGLVLTTFQLASGFLQEALAPLSPEERRVVLIGAPLFWSDDDDKADDTLKGALHRAWGQPVDTTGRADVDTLLSLAAKVNRQALLAATYAFWEGLWRVAQQWQQVAAPFEATQAEGVDGLVIAKMQTPFGPFVIGGRGPNVYRRPFAFVLDLGGDDRYLARAGSGVGDLGPFLSATIDLGGNDDYESRALADQGAGILGLGALLDFEGADTYRAGFLSQGCGFFGSGLLYDAEGDDIYEAHMCVHGAATVGLGLLVDVQGRDIYDAYGCAQGFAGTFGVGTLADLEGNDVYRAGGHYLHRPLRPLDFRSYAHGFAIGSRPRAGGGIGVLYDRSGNDFYNAEIYAQGTSYWYSLGMLIDESGQDIYNATQYAQGAGVHLSIGYLCDGAGDDSYHSRFGPGQGGAHDLAVGILIDGQGDDTYSISGGQGVALTNSVAILLDGEGNDTYMTTEDKHGQGGVRPARGFGNIGLFVDMEGRDCYPDMAKKDSALWFEAYWGIGLDVAFDSVAPDEGPIEIELSPEDTLPSVEEIFKEAALWEVSENRARVRRARKALIAKGSVAVQWVAQNKLATRKGLEVRAIRELFEALPDEATPYLLQALQDSGLRKRKNAAQVLGHLKRVDAVPVMLEYLAMEDYEKARNAIIGGLGDIGDSTATTALVPYTRSELERRRIAATVALGKISDARAIPCLFGRLGDPFFTVRSAALHALAKFGKEILAPFQAQLRTRDPAKLEKLLLLAGELARGWKGREDGTTASSAKRLRALVGRYLEHPSPRVRSAALLATAPFLNRKAIMRLSREYAKETDPVVLARWRAIRREFILP